VLQVEFSVIIVLDFRIVDCEKENHRPLWLTWAWACFKGARFAAASISVEVFGSIVQIDVRHKDP
jgi:hypothetical protein